MPFGLRIIGKIIFQQGIKSKHFYILWKMSPVKKDKIV